MGWNGMGWNGMGWDGMGARIDQMDELIEIADGQSSAHEQR